LRRQVAVLQSEVARQFPVHGIVGQSAPFQRALGDARKAAETDATVLIGGESGTGKELLARLVHALSARREEPFVAVHCAALPETLMESELFGHERGAFTGADRRRVGRFEIASSGTLFFDEVSEMPPAVQVKLLRVLQEKEFTRVGGAEVIRTNARIVAASAKDLKQEVAAGRFRDDLFYRLHVVPVRLPPLRERQGDVPLLVEHFLAGFRESMHVRTSRVEPAAMEALCAYRWPGNVRELRNVIERTLVLHGQQEELQAAFLPDDLRAAPPGAPPPPPAAAGEVRLADAVDAYERQLVSQALRAAGGVQTRAAELLGTTRRILKYRMEKLGIEAPDPTDGA
jgi:two-component system response regulator HydG